MSEVLCPKCGSDQITANKKGFSGKQAVAGAVLTGGVGLLAGTIGSNKVRITCLSCGHQFKPGQGAKSQDDFKKKNTNIGVIYDFLGKSSEIMKDSTKKMRDKRKADKNSGCLVLVVVFVMIGTFCVVLRTMLFD